MPCWPRPRVRASARDPGPASYQALDESPIAPCKGNVHDVLQHNKHPPLKKATLSKNKRSYQKMTALNGTLKWLAAFCVLECVCAVAPFKAPEAVVDILTMDSALEMKSMW